MKVVVINGAGGVGKDSFVKLCQSNFNYKIENISTVDKVKEFAKQMGWNGEKTEESRHFLSDLKDLWTKYYDGPMMDVTKKVIFCKMTGYDVVFIHCREPKEIQRLKERFNADTLLIKRDTIEKIESNHADAEVENFSYDYVIENNGTIEDLKQKAIDFIKGFE